MIIRYHSPCMRNTEAKTWKRPMRGPPRDSYIVSWNFFLVPLQKIPLLSCSKVLRLSSKVPVNVRDPLLLISRPQFCSPCVPIWKRLVRRDDRDICCSLKLIQKKIPCFLKMKHRVPLFLQDSGRVSLYYMTMLKAVELKTTASSRIWLCW